MAHLRKLPTYFVKGDDRRAAYYTVQAAELREAGYVEEGTEKARARVIDFKLPEQPVEAGADAFEDLMDDEQKDNLDEMTKAELLEWAYEQGHDLKNALPKAEILKQCKEIEEALK